MALPRKFPTAAEYFNDIAIFLFDHQYLFNFANTDLLVRNVLDQICIENLDDVDVFGDFELQELEANASLKDFLRNIEQFEVDIEYIVADQKSDEIKFKAPLSPKKLHEIVYLAEQIKTICDSIDCSTVVDFGSGLGYLDQRLFEIAHYNILGLECNENYYVEAKKRQRKYHEHSLEKVKYLRHMIRDDSDETIVRYLDEKFATQNDFCITGLHACADLTIDAINLFLKMDECKAMVIMSCCYHKMLLQTNRFKNFPVSNCCINVFDRCSCEEFMTIPFLRLAAQPPDSKNDLRSLAFNLLARGVLQLYAYRHDCKLKRSKRKAVRMKAMANNFDIYLEDATKNGFKLLKTNGKGETETQNFDLREIKDIWNELPADTFKKAAIFIKLQNMLQPVIENFILFDRLVYLRENGIEHCYYKRICNKFISPRCLALIACK